ncbi:flagellar basal body P-ring formation chaperone FlgA [Lichenibacterium ramalinae]|uniref:Flagella basal body P-ring formation protein FlgA n=1 Tax=Lichenibacterium ramalinae TaxID=2316527 RepID=A0A4V1RIX7_9HYPH|nr:flagellar basal body P-ring formation chaperone FlgA [Lichenibacterium ramalinae]RYB06105.1 flagella basal body P-ring formation protein FlgA [Lichenibacterium ramalinae]
MTRPLRRPRHNGAARALAALRAAPAVLALRAAPAVLALWAAPALAGQFVPVPAVVIYPGDIIRDGMLTEMEMPDDFAGRAAAVLDRNALVNKTSRRTLLPRLPIPKNAIGEPKVVSLNAMVRIVYAEGGLTIATYGSALQSGAIGDVIPVRNLESGLTVSGTIGGDGAVHVFSGAGAG